MRLASAQLQTVSPSRAFARIASCMPHNPMGIFTYILLLLLLLSAACEVLCDFTLLALPLT